MKGKNVLIHLYDLQTYKMFRKLRELALQHAFKAAGMVTQAMHELPGISSIPAFPDFNFN